LWFDRGDDLADFTFFGIAARSLGVNTFRARRSYAWVATTFIPGT
jgi:hypothetical protein